MLKSLLASAAALATLTVAHAADLPMTKAEPVEYVKVCSEFGDGFYYIPGSDTCLSINGYVRADYWWFEPDSRADNGLEFGSRGRVNFDARTATEWGTLRSFLSLQYTDHDDQFSMNADKAFIQFGGWTAGYATSFYDFYDAEAGNTLKGTYFSSSKTTHLLAYTAVFGNGLAASLSVEDNYIRREGIGSFSDYLISSLTAPNFVGDDSYDYYGGQRAPDVVASLRWTQDWGSVQIMAAAHETRSDLSTSVISGFGTPVSDNQRWGFAVGAGVMFNLPSGFFFALEGNYTRGAASYAGLGDGRSNDVVDAAVPDFILVNLDFTGHLDLSRAWSVTADLGYNFTPSLVGHLVGSYADYEAPGATVDVGTAFGVAPAGVPGLTDFKTWAVTGNLAYTIVKGLTIAGEVSYERRDYDMNFFDFSAPPVFGAFSVNPDYSTWSAGMRLKRSF